jgi:uncharacterized coiled-coil protein SlyX
MKIFKKYLGIDGLEDRIEILEQRVDNHEKALQLIADALKKNSQNVVELSKYIRKIIDLANRELRLERTKEDDVFH